MFELLKLIAEFLTKNVNIPDIIKGIRGKQKRTLGVELFFLFTSLNEIYTLGAMIISQIETATELLARYQRENRMDEYYIANDLKFMVEQQYINILHVAYSLRRLGIEMQIIDPAAYAQIVPLLHSKASIISRLLRFNYFHGVYHPAVTFCNSDKIKEILTFARDYYRPREHNTGKSSMQYMDRGDYMGWELGLFEASSSLKTVDDHIELQSIDITATGQIMPDQLPKMKAYLATEPKKQLQTLHACVESLHRELLKHFDIGDVLAEVGKSKGANPSSYLW